MLTDVKDKFAAMVGHMYYEVFGEEIDVVEMPGADTWIVNGWLWVQRVAATDWQLWASAHPSHPANAYVCLKGLAKGRAKFAGPWDLCVRMLIHEAHLQAHLAVEETARLHGFQAPKTHPAPATAV